VSLANRASFNSNERASTVTSELQQCRARARVKLSRAGIERAVRCVGSFAYMPALKRNACDRAHTCDLAAP
jgi:hypothetical protein